MGRGFWIDFRLWQIHLSYEYMTATLKVVGRGVTLSVTLKMTGNCLMTKEHINAVV